MPNIVVTGSASGIGAATVARLVDHGHTVVGIDRSGADIIADLSTSQGRTDAIAEAGFACRSLVHGVVCCAGLGSLSNHSGGELIAVNFFGTVEVLRGLRPAMARAHPAAAVAISSSSSTTQPGIPADLVEACLSGGEDGAVALADQIGPILSYSASKLALARWVRREAVHSEWIGKGIRLNAVAPGMIDTPMTSGDDLDPELAKSLDHYPIPMGRRGQPQEVASVIDFLLGHGSSLMCGSILFADGGTDAQVRHDDWPNTWRPTQQEFDGQFGEY